jgi:hypothetical protein
MLWLLKTIQPSVFVNNNGLVQCKTVEIGQTLDYMVVILKGLVEGEKVVVSGSDNISEGQKVIIQ